MTEKLLPCPFCGGTAREPSPHDDRHLNSVVTWHVIKCDGCYATIKYPSRDGAVAKWNSRTNQARIAELERVLSSFVNVRDQFPESMKLIQPKLDGLTPVTVTVTKNQFLAAVDAIARASLSVGETAA